MTGQAPIDMYAWSKLDTIERRLVHLESGDALAKEKAREQLTTVRHELALATLKMENSITALKEWQSLVAARARIALWVAMGFITALISADPASNVEHIIKILETVRKILELAKPLS